MAKESRAKAALGGKKSESKSKSKSKSPSKGGKKNVHRMHISKTDNGKFLVDHEYKGGPDEAAMPNESHALNPEELAAHVADHFGVGAGGPGAPMAAGPAGPTPEPTPVAPLPAGPTGV